MSYRPRWDSGDWLAICDVCGRKFKASRLMKRWDGMMTCPDDWEPRQPQDFVRGVADFQAPPYTRPEPQDIFITDFCTLNGRSAISGFAVAGCSVAGNSYFDPSIYRSTQNQDAIAGIAIAGIATAGKRWSLQPPTY